MAPDSKVNVKACDACRRRKLRCRQNILDSSSGSRCIRCVQTELQCTYNDERRRRGPRTGSRLRELRASQAVQPGEPLCPPPSPGLSPEEPDGQEDETPEAGRLGDEEHHASQFTDAASYRLSQEYFEDQSFEDSHGDVYIASNFNIDDRLIFDTPNILPFGLHPAPGSTSSGVPELIHQSNSTISDESGIDLSKEAIIAEVSQCFSAVYQRYPLWHLDTLLGKIQREEQKSSDEFRSTCLSIYLLNESVLFRKNPQHGSSRLVRLTKEIESTRSRANNGHFADWPSTNSVVASLVLFIAYSVCDRHNLAFYHLNEAAGLLRLIDVSTLDSLEKSLYRRLEAVLFITEPASMLVYGKMRKSRMVPCPEDLSSLESSMRWYTEQYQPSSTLPAELADIRLGALDNKAVDLLYALVRLYNATTAEEISQVSIPSPAVSEIIEQGVLGSTSLQAADVDITRQWQLCLRWQEVLSSRKNHVRGQSNSGAGYTLQIMGLTVLQYSRAIRPGDGRIVGHGKLASLATAIYDIASSLGILASCTTIIGDLIRTVYEMDYEQCFSPELSVVQLCIEEVPRQLTFGEQESQMVERR